MERRHLTSPSKGSSLPNDYLNMISDVFSGHFDEGLKIYNKISPNSGFIAAGEIFSDEVILSISLVTQGKLAATTAITSMDFDPKASSPTVQDLLSACIDAAATLFSTLLDSAKPEQISILAEDSLASLEDAPFIWTPVESNQQRVFVKVDKSNPLIDRLTDDWIKKHDPYFEEQVEKDQEETKKLFFTGPKSLNIQNTRKSKKS